MAHDLMMDRSAKTFDIGIDRVPIIRPCKMDPLDFQDLATIVTLGVHMDGIFTKYLQVFSSSLLSWMGA